VVDKLMAWNKPFYRMICVKILKNMLKMCFRAIDQCTAILVSLFLPLFFLITKYFIYPQKEFRGERNILFLSGGSTLEDCYRKFGNFEPLFNYDGPIKSFNRVILFWYLTRNNLTVALRDDYIINERKGIRILPFTSQLLLLFEFLFLVKRKNIKVIRAFDPYQKGLMGWAISKLAGIPFCISIHADYDKCYRLDGRKGGTPFLFKIIEKFVLPRTQMVMPISEYLGRLVKNRGVAPEKIRILLHGINMEKFLNPPNIDLNSEFLIPKDKNILCMVGRLSRQKYVYDAFEVARRLAQRRDDFILVFVGDGQEKKGLESLVEKERLSKNVKIVGFQSNERVAAILSQSYLALCLLAGFSLIEACVAGLPAICYDIEWHTELIKNGENGFIVKEGNLDALTKKVAYLLDHPEEAKKMGARASEIAIAKHNALWTSQVKENCYKELLSYL
jgi:glycosyltransferase involved in cell wall biosynthesis